jgi:hypothetical protein
MRDAVGAADRLQATVRTTVDELVAAAPAPPGEIYVGWVAAAEAGGCPARFRAGGEDGWGFPGWSPGTAAAAVGRAALDRHLDGPGTDRLPDPLEAVRSWMRACGTLDARGVAGWIGELRDDRDAAALAATAAGAARWLAGFLRVLGWPLPDRTALLNVTREGTPSSGPRWWPAKGSPVTVGSGADARIGRVRGRGDHVLVVHRPSSGDDREVHRRAVFEAAAGALVHRVAPDAVLMTAGDTGDRSRVVVDEGALAAGAAMIVEVVRQRVAAVDRAFDAADATPSGACRWCALRAGCPPGSAWLAGPGRWRAGLPVLAGGV